MVNGLHFFVDQLPVQAKSLGRFLDENIMGGLSRPCCVFCSRGRKLF